MAERDVIPDPLYSCADDGCAAEASYPADDLMYWRGGRHVDAAEEVESENRPEGFYCEHCIAHLGIPGGETLTVVLARINE